MEQEPFQEENYDHPNFSVQEVLMPGSYQTNIHYLSPNVPIDRQLPDAFTHRINETVDDRSSLVSSA